MMNMRLRTSLWAMTERGVDPAPVVVVERIRVAMLAALDHDCHADHARLTQKITFGRDVGVLWYLRADLLDAISECRHESMARRALANITALFQGHHPIAPTFRRDSLPPERVPASGLLQ